MDSILFNLSPVKTQSFPARQYDDSRKTEPGQDNNIPSNPGVVDKLSLSPEARKLLAKSSTPGKSDAQNSDDAHVSQIDGKEEDKQDKKDGKKTELKDSEKLTVQKLKLTDLHVKMHEQQHISVGGAYVRGGPAFKYATGPDGNNYAVGGEVQIDTSPIRDNPKATIHKAQTVRQAALAPSDPSGTDRGVAAAATAMELKASGELAQQGENGKGNSSDSANSKNTASPNTSHSSPSRKQLSAYQSSRNFSVGKVINQFA